MPKAFNPEEYNMIFCPVCKGNGKLPRNPYGFDVCKECGGFGFVKVEPEGDMNDSLTTGGRKGGPL